MDIGSERSPPSGWQWDDPAIAGGTSLIPYRSSEFFELERENIFRRAWLMVGRVEEVAAPGDFLVKKVEVLDSLALVVRGKDDVIRAFHNVCPHRANQVVWETQGKTPVFVCRYHNWSFNTDGTVRGIPDESSFADLDKKNCGLPPINLQVWEGWIFLNFSKTPPMPLEEFLGPMRDHLGGLDYCDAATPVVFEADLRCNWKLISDAFAEAYHIPAIHAVSLAPRFSNSENRFGRPIDARVLGIHGTNSMFGNPDYVASPSQHIERLAFDPAYVAPDTAANWAKLKSHPAVNPAKQPGWSMDVNYVFPNLHLDFGQTGFFTHSFWPISVTQSRHEARFYLPRSTTPRERFSLEHKVAHLFDIMMEDLSNVERTQSAINSGATDTMQLSSSEGLIRHMNTQIARWARATDIADLLSI